jgi:hypothetical protein
MFEIQNIKKNLQENFVIWSLYHIMLQSNASVDLLTSSGIQRRRIDILDKIGQILAFHGYMGQSVEHFNCSLCHLALACEGEDLNENERKKKKSENPLN